MIRPLCPLLRPESKEIGDRLSKKAAMPSPPKKRPAQPSVHPPKETPVTAVLPTWTISETRWRILLGIVIAVYLLFQWFYLTATPLQPILLPDNLPKMMADKPLTVGIGPDEKEHFLYILSIANRGQLPKPTPKYRTSPDDYVSYQAQHPPLFYALAAIIYKMTAPLGESTVWYVLRGLCTLCGIATILFVANTARELFPDMPLAAIIATAFAALLPIFGFMHGTLSNEPLALALGSYVWWQSVRLLRQTEPPTLQSAAIMGTVMALAIGTRLTAIIWLPVAMFALLRHGRRAITPSLIFAALSVLPLILLAIYNTANYGTPFLRTFYRPAVGTYAIDADFLRLTLLWYNTTAWYPHWLTQFYLPGGVDGKIMAIPLLANVVLLLLVLRNFKDLTTTERRIAKAAIAAVVLCVGGTLQQQLFADWNVLLSAGRYLVAVTPAAALLVVIAMGGKRLSNNRRSVTVAVLCIAALFLLNLLMVGDVRRFYREHPTQAAVQTVT